MAARSEGMKPRATYVPEQHPGSLPRAPPPQGSARLQWLLCVPGGSVTGGNSAASFTPEKWGSRKGWALAWAVTHGPPAGLTQAVPGLSGQWSSVKRQSPGGRTLGWGGQCLVCKAQRPICAAHGPAREVKAKLPSWWI